MKRYIQSAVVDISNEDRYVKSEVARNPNTPVELLRTLSTDSDEIVRRMVASNPATPPDTLRQLASDNEWPVLYEVAMNSNTPSDVLTDLYNRNAFINITEAIASNPNTPSDILHKIADAGDMVWILSLLYNPNLPKDIVDRFTSRQYIDDIRSAAIEVYNSRFNNNND